MSLPTNQQPVFLQAGYPSYRVTNTVKALKEIRLLPLKWRISCCVCVWLTNEAGKKPSSGWRASCQGIQPIISWSGWQRQRVVSYSSGKMSGYLLQHYSHESWSTALEFWKLQLIGICTLIVHPFWCQPLRISNKIKPPFAFVCFVSHLASPSPRCRCPQLHSEQNSCGFFTLNMIHPITWKLRWWKRHKICSFVTFLYMTCLYWRNSLGNDKKQTWD